jgi:hypothetical protein
MWHAHKAGFLVVYTRQTEDSFEPQVGLWEVWFRRDAAKLPRTPFLDNLPSWRISIT